MSEQNSGNATVLKLIEKNVAKHIAQCKRCKLNESLAALGYKGKYCQLRGLIDRQS